MDERRGLGKAGLIQLHFFWFLQGAQGSVHRAACPLRSFPLSLIFKTIYVSLSLSLCGCLSLSSPCLYVCCMRVCACACGGHRKVSGVLLFHPPPFSLETSSGAHQCFDRLASQQAPGILLLAPLAALALQENEAIPCSYLVAGDPNSGSHA